MKKKILIACAVFLVLGGTFAFAQSAKAQTVADLQAQIQSLLATIAQLQEQVAQLQGGGTPAWCFTFDRNLKFGNGGRDVEMLHIALQKAGFSVGAEANTKEFGEQTASAVVGFQQKYAQEILAPNGLQYGTGFVGPSTRAKLNQLYGCGIIIPPPPIYKPSITVLSPNSGEKWMIGNTYEIKWTRSNLPIGEYNPRIDLYRGGSYYGNIKTWSVVEGLKQQIFTETSLWKVGDIAGGVSGGSDYQIYIIFNSTDGRRGFHDISDGYFSIVDSSTPQNLPPVVDGVTGPTKLGVAQQGTWTVKAHDPENGILSYSVLWGDELAGAIAQLSPSRSGEAGQTATFTHVYSKAGTYTVQFTVSDLTQSARTSITVVVGESVQPSITVLSPNGGETLQSGDTLIVSWKNTPDIQSVRVVLWGASDPKYFDTPVSTSLTSYTISQGAYAPRGYVRWIVDPDALRIVGIDLSRIRYFKVNLEGYKSVAGDVPRTVVDFLAQDSSDNYFSIVASSTQPL
ncbi:MAG: PKD domain-containing protein [Patescibacteria group bacterium]